MFESGWQRWVFGLWVAPPTSHCTVLSQARLPKELRATVLRKPGDPLLSDQGIQESRHH